ncbi:GreA/GreB family elongation factor [Sediminibacterium sp.]|uniref:GreA/GreB family elongation factor n=1 Tax=Sediminibacterium sp. TaxID=1917865 RepID=UPI003F6F2385
MKQLITPKGLELMQLKLNDKIERLKSIRKEKAHAYTASGDGWHDNPGWTQLGQLEEQLAKEINDLQQTISKCQIVEFQEQDMEKVQIGSRVDYAITSQLGKSINQTVYIVGAGETDVKNKKISYNSPIGEALCSMRLGEIKQVHLPAGPVKINILKISYE